MTAGRASRVPSSIGRGTLTLCQLLAANARGVGAAARRTVDTPRGHRANVTCGTAPPRCRSRGRAVRPMCPADPVTSREGGGRCRGPASHLGSFPGIPTRRALSAEFGRYARLAVIPAFLSAPSCMPGTRDALRSAITPAQLAIRNNPASNPMGHAWRSPTGVPSSVTLNVSPACCVRRGRDGDHGRAA